MEKNLTRRTTLAIAIASALAVGAYMHQQSPLSNAHANAAQEQALKADAAPAISTRQLPDFVSLVESQGPAVVNISVTAKMEQLAGQNMPPELPEFFKRNREFPSKCPSAVASVPVLLSAPTVTC